MQKAVKGFFPTQQKFCCNIVPGHSLVIPKRHYESLFELNDEELTELIRLGRDVAKVLSEVLSTSALNWAIQEKTIAGQSVPHRTCM